MIGGSNTPRRAFVATGALQRELEPFALPLLPPLSPLIGREQALERCVRLLRSERFLTIEGISGVGKTALARHIVEQFDLPVLLINARAGLAEQIERWLTLTASGLANHGDRRLWDVQEFERQCGGRVSLVIKICYLLEMLRDRPVLLWIDNAHVLFEEPEALGVFADIRSELRFRSSYRCAVMLSGLSFPGELNDYQPFVLEGLDEPTAQALLSTLVPSETVMPEWELLWESMRRELPAYTGGNPGLLGHIARALQAALPYPPQDATLHSLLTERPLSSYLLEHFWQPLSSDLRSAIARLVQTGERSWERSQLLELLVSVNPQSYIVLTQLYSNHVLHYDPQIRKLIMVPALADFWRMIAPS